MPWWGWLLAAFGLSALLAIVFRKQFGYLMRIAKMLTTDDRLPRPLRWTLSAALAIKVVPVPDLGIDEVLLVIIGLLLVTVYRPTLKAILEESKLEAPAPR